MNPYLLLTIFLIFSQYVTAQDLSVITSSGSTTTTGNLQIEWSLGEVVSDSKGTEVQEGFIQSFSISELVTSINEDFVHKITAYPNPTLDILYLDNLNENIKSELILYDLSGKVLLHEKIEGKKTVSLDLNNFDPGKYLINLSSENSKQSYKIIKQ